MRRRIIPLLVVVIGLLILFYPTISNILIVRNASRVVSRYDAAIEALSDEEYQRILAQARAYNERLAAASDGTTDALAGAVGAEAADEEYSRLLDINGDGMMGYLTIPRLDETIPIYHGTSEAVLQVGSGHLEGTSLPIGGDSTHAAISGHRGLPTAKLFTDLNLMREGDRFYIRILKDTYAYEVDSITTVLPTDASELAIRAGEDRVTLITCTPYAVNTHRLLVGAHRIPYTPDQETDAEARFHLDIPLQYLLPACGLLALLLGWGHARRREERNLLHPANHRKGSAKHATRD